MTTCAHSHVLVTGAPSGIGRATTLRLARNGHHVVAGVRKPVDGAALVEAAGGDVTPVILDVTDPQQVASAVELIAGRVGDAGLAGLVNNAGIGVFGPLELIPVEQFRRQLEVNVTGQLAITRAALPLLRPARGRIVMIGSIGALHAAVRRPAGRHQERAGHHEHRPAAGARAVGHPRDGGGAGQHPQRGGGQARERRGTSAGRGDRAGPGAVPGRVRPPGGLLRRPARAHPRSWRRPSSGRCAPPVPGPPTCPARTRAAWRRSRGCCRCPLRTRCAASSPASRRLVPRPSAGVPIASADGSAPRRTPSAIARRQPHPGGVRRPAHDDSTMVGIGRPAWH